MRKIFRVGLLTLVAITMVSAASWGACALWFRLPVAEVFQGLAAGFFFVAGIGLAFLLYGRWRLVAVGAFAVGMVMLMGWWSTITPKSDSDWAADVSRQVTGNIQGDMLTLANVRSFNWRSDSDFMENWETRSYDLSKVETLDLFMSYWSGPSIAHVMLSFGFENGAHLAWSIEVRRTRGGAFSPVADLFKSNPLVIVAADERDVIGVRSNVRGEDVQLYHLKTSREAARTLLEQYVADSNALAETPKFYNSITSNCSSTIVQMMRAVGDRVPFDWRLVVNGYLPDYAYDEGALDKSLPLVELKKLSHIDQKARADGLTDNFSRAIRVGVPSPP